MPRRRLVRWEVKKRHVWNARRASRMATAGASVMVELGFEYSRTAACVYVHRARCLRVVAHVDDFVVTGPKSELVELRRQLEVGYEVDGDILGLEADEKRQGKFLGRRVVR